MIWDAGSGRSLNTLAGHEGSLSQATWHLDGNHVAVAIRAGIVYLWDLTGVEPLCLARFYEASPVTGLVVTHDGYVDGPQKALDNVRFADGWALYDLNDLPERHSPELVTPCVRVVVAPLGDDRMTGDAADALFSRALLRPRRRPNRGASWAGRVKGAKRRACARTLGVPGMGTELEVIE